MHLAAIFYYPIKSCRGTRADRVAVTGRGIEGDRRWLLVDPGRRFLTQRQHPRLARIEPRLAPDELRVTAPGMRPLRLDRDTAGERIEVGIWKDRCGAIDQGDEAAAWFSAFLGERCRLVRQADDAIRPVDPRYARAAADQVSFADAYPFLLTSEASLADLNRRLPRALPMDRFRPNLVVAGSAPYAEDIWRTLRIGGLRFEVVKPCARCVITTIDQETAEKGNEPLRTLEGYRRGERGVLFGQNLIHAQAGTLRTGARIEVLEDK